MKFYKNSHSTFYSTLLLSIVSMVSIVFTPSIALASSWSPTLLVNTEAFQTIDNGDGSTNIELRFGDTGSGLILNVTDNQFEFDTELEIQGTASGRNLHAQDGITSSGTLVVEGKATFGSSITLNGVEYIFPFGDASATGKLLASDGAGNLSWTSAGSTPNVFQTLSVSGQSDIVSDAASDTLTFAEGSNVTITTDAGTDTITIAATDTSQATTFTLSGDGGGSDQTISHGNTLEIAGGTSITTTASATDTLTVDITDDTVDFAELADSLTVDAATTISLGSNNFNIDTTSTGEFRIDGTASGTRLHADTALTSSGTLAVDGSVTFRNLTSCTNLTTNSAGVLACNNTDYITETELDTEAELEAQLTDVSNVIVGTEIDTESELEAIVGIDFIKDADIDTLAELEGVVNTTNIIIGADIDTESEFEAIVGVDFLKGSEVDTEGELESFLTDASNVIVGTEIDTESELEAILTNVTNVFTNNDGTLADDDLSDNDTDDLSEGSSNLYFTNERVDDRLSAFLQAGTGITLTYDDAGNTLTIQQGFSSGSQVSLSPEYAGAVYYGDTTNNVGQMVLAYDSTNKENYYKWNSTVSSLQDYNIAVRVKVPDDFDHWDGSVPIQFRYRTNAASADDNQMDITMLDTAGSSVSLTGGTNFANTSWTTATITGPEAAGTYTPGSYITIIIAMQARSTNTGEAHAGFLNINWHTEP